MSTFTWATLTCIPFWYRCQENSGPTDRKAVTGASETGHRRLPFYGERPGRGCSRSSTIVHDRRAGKRWTLGELRQNHSVMEVGRCRNANMESQRFAGEAAPAGVPRPAKIISRRSRGWGRRHLGPGRQHEFHTKNIRCLNAGPESELTTQRTSEPDRKPGPGVYVLGTFC
jgi:hypothetical protein